MIDPPAPPYSSALARLDDDAETFGAIPADVWFTSRGAILEHLAAATALRGALATLADRMKHYTYSQENRDALAKAEEVLSKYQPTVENTRNG